MSTSGSRRRTRPSHLDKRVGKYYVGRTIGEVREQSNVKDETPEFYENVY